MMKKLLFLLTLVVISQSSLFAQQDSIQRKDSAYTPSRTSPFNLGERDKYGDKYTSGSRGNYDEKNCVKLNFGLFARGIAGLEYERAIANTWTVQGGLGFTVFRDYINELWLEEEGLYSDVTPESEGNGLHISAEGRYHFDDIFDDFFVGFATRYTSYPLKYDASVTGRKVTFNENNTDVLVNIGWGATYNRGVYYEMLFGAGLRQVNTINMNYSSNYVTTGNYSTTVNQYKTDAGEYLRPMIVFSVKMGGIF
jgi:hypothetical protein